MMSDTPEGLGFNGHALRLTGLEIKVVWKLNRRGKYGGSHTSMERIANSFRSDLRGEAAEAIRELIREQIILSKPTHYGMEISLNQNRIPLIRDICAFYEANVDRVKDREIHAIA
jgi:hypothetical protein